MTDRKKIEYRLDLTSPSLGSQPKRLNGSLVRGDLAADLDSLAELMISAHMGTIDYDGESLDDAQEEVRSFLEGTELKPLPACSWMFAKDRTLLALCLVGWWVSRQSPLVAYIMTRREWNNQGLAKIVLSESLLSLKKEGYEQVLAFITQGNLSSEKLFQGFDFLPEG